MNKPPFPAGENWGGTIKKYWMKWLLEEYPPNFHKPWFSKIRVDITMMYRYDMDGEF